MTSPKAGFPPKEIRPLSLERKEIRADIHGLEATKQSLSNIGRQLSFATVLALTHTAKEVQGEEITYIGSSLFRGTCGIAIRYPPLADIRRTETQVITRSHRPKVYKRALNLETKKSIPLMVLAYRAGQTIRLAGNIPADA